MTQVLTELPAFADGGVEFLSIVENLPPSGTRFRLQIAACEDCSDSGPAPKGDLFGFVPGEEN